MKASASHSLILPVPPSVNNATAVVRGRKIKSKAYRQWQVLAGMQARIQGLASVPSPYSVSIKIVGGKGWSRARDLDNAIKGVLDLLVALEVVAGDNCMHCISARIDYRRPDKGRARCVVKVEHLEDASHDR